MARLSALVECAAKGEITIITRHGKPQAVLLGIEEWDRLRNVPSFGRLLLSAPLKDGDLEPRDASPPRLTELQCSIPVVDPLDRLPG